MHIRLSEACALRARSQIVMEIARPETAGCRDLRARIPIGKILTADDADGRRFLEEMTGCDPSGVVGECGDRGPGVCDPGLCDGYAPHTLNCCTPEGVQRKTIYTGGNTKRIRIPPNSASRRDASR